MSENRLAVIDKKLCAPDRCGRECAANCPVNKMRQECITIDEIAQIDENLCTGCGICVKKCPFHAITIIKNAAPEPERLVYSYGVNGFKLYGLALPRKGLTAVIGENGCGKSTNAKLLAGELKPENTPTTEIRDYFKQERELAVKPQELGADISGKVGGLLEKIDDGQLAELKELFDLQKVWEREFKQLSGGELQKVVVAATLMQNKEAFILDEPFAFLDYVYRIRLINYLKEKFSEKSVLLIDHDISLLSYVASGAYLLYGANGAFGSVSQSYSTDRAINMFLDGFIAPENVKFRSQPVKYKSYNEEKPGEELYFLEPAEVDYGSFKVENKHSLALHQGEIVGVAGPNGIGKTTLIKEYCKQDPDNLTLKPQILERGDEIVAKHLKTDTPFKQLFIEDMDLKRIEYYKLDDLSGGELQKTRIYQCLSSDKHNAYVLDEPTNMLDVKARVALCKMLREKAKEGKAVLVVDHDLEFLLNTVDRLLVMDGEPAKHGEVKGIYHKDEGVRLLLKKFDLSYRRDPATKRLKLNKAGSQKDRALKKSGEFVEAH
jgi:ATP-binding cassette, sub-family E, member 1